MDAAPLAPTEAVCFQDVEIKEEGKRHILILFNCKMGMAGSVDFAAANAKSSAQLRVKGDRNKNVGLSNTDDVLTQTGPA